VNTTLAATPLRCATSVTFAPGANVSSTIRALSSCDQRRRWNGSQAYAETKFQNVLLAFAAARLFPEVKSNALEPGWVPTKMGGAGAPDDINKPHLTQVWLATSDETAATVSGRYFFHQKQRDPDLATTDIERQDVPLDLCRKVSGTALNASRKTNGVVPQAAALPRGVGGR
jgi:NAD(P)-dependent dehydrogenase (short-subunit alcohol dehydrogenase family)